MSKAVEVVPIPLHPIIQFSFNKDPTDSLTQKLDTILKKLLNEKKSTNPSTMPAAPPIPVDLKCMDSQNEKYTNLEILFVPPFLFIVHHCHRCINNYLLF